MGETYLFKDAFKVRLTTVLGSTPAVTTAYIVPLIGQSCRTEMSLSTSDGTMTITASLNDYALS